MADALAKAARLTKVAAFKKDFILNKYGMD